MYAPEPDNPCVTSAARCMERPLSLLLVEDSKDDAELVLEQLRRDKIDARTDRVATAEALSAALRHQSWDAVISDFKLPGFSGLAALEMVRSAGLDIPFVLLSGRVDEATAVAAIKAGASDYIMKGNLVRLAPTLKRELKAKEQRAAQLVLEAELKMLSLAVRQSSIGIVITDPTGAIEFVNPGFEKMCGYSAAELMGKNQRLLKSGLTPAETYQDMWKTITSGNEWRGELQNLRKGGELYCEFQHISPVLNDAGKILNFVVIKDDVTQNKRAEQALKQLVLAMDVSPDAIYLTDLQTLRFTYVNDAAMQRFGYTREQMLLKGPSDMTGRTPDQIRREFDEVIVAGDLGTSLEQKIMLPDGRKQWSDLRRRAVQIDGTMLIVSISRDITKRKIAEKKVRRMNRMYAVLSGINSMIIRVGNRDELYREVCRIAKEVGEFSAAYVAIADAAQSHLHPLNLVGTEAEFAEETKARFSLRDEAAEGHGPAATAFRERRIVAVNDVEISTSVHYKTAHAKYGIRALAILPLYVAGEPVAILGLHSSEPDCFDAAEIKLLTELSNDVSFSLDNLIRQEKLDYLAFYDHLTGLPNRVRLVEEIDRLIQNQQKFALAILDIDRLRAVNESLGREAGDAVIIEFGKRIAQQVGKSRTARIGSDQFAILLPMIKGKSEASRTLESLCSACLSEPFHAADADLRISARAGISVFPNDGADAETLLRNAEAARATAKECGERYVYFESALIGGTRERLTLESQLQQALEKNQFVLHYQPKVALDSRRIVGVEALIRWQSPELGLVPPGKFIPLMESTGLILDVGAWALGKAVEDHAAWQTRGLGAPRIAVNVSAIQLRRRNFVCQVEAILRRGAMPPGIDLEVTESLVMQDIESGTQKLRALRDLGVSIAIDDFGTGYSSLGYLSRLPVKTLKIDRSFISSMMHEPDRMMLVQTMISLAHSLRLEVVAEGVEEEEQAKILHLLRCDQMQGYLFSRPLPFDQMTALLEKEAESLNMRSAESSPNLEIVSFPIHDLVN